MTAVRAAVTIASALAAAGAAHAAWNRRQLRHLRPGTAAPLSPGAERVSILVPARDEASQIDGCLAALRAQTGVPDLEILVLDDASDDDTADRVRRHAADDPRVRLLTGSEEPPDGWLGKPFACRRLGAAATGTVLVFVDADVRLHPDAVVTAVTDLRRNDLTLLSAWPRQSAVTHLGRMIQPLQQWSWLTTIPLQRAARSGRASMAAANGQFLILDRIGYDRIDGHAAVAGEVLEDIWLARAVKTAGLHADLVDAAAVAECRMYDTDAQLVDGYSKSLWRAFGGPARGVLVTAALAMVYGLPPGYALLGGHPPTRAVAALGYGAAVANRVVAAQATGSPAWPTSTEHPVAMLVLLGLTVRSARMRRTGALRWRGRTVTT